MLKQLACSSSANRAMLQEGNNDTVRLLFYGLLKAVVWKTNYSLKSSVKLNHRSVAKGTGYFVYVKMHERMRMNTYA